MLTFEGHRYNGEDQAFVRALMDKIAKLDKTVEQLLAQSKTETRIKR